ncbi:hypothetical protein Nepgr_006639 [Nepenthes gracilis]|uniref:Uncharacterized protein n=1 Tax=Nepenthes gracilis TaxID=150966 RepID=A0AAD3XHJ5_NEPGR|nr:hypothetical protein Nepgr_006639 [Nepenthes gracilis]
MGATTTLESQLPDSTTLMHPNQEGKTNKKATGAETSSRNKWSSNAAPTKPASTTFDHSIVQPREPAYKASANITADNISHHLLHLTQQHIRLSSSESRAGQLH